METSAIRPDSSALTRAASLAKSPREEQNEIVSSPREEINEGAVSSTRPTESRSQFSDSGLRLLASFQSRGNTVNTSGNAIKDTVQAQRTITDLNNAIQKTPDLAGAAQSNLTSNVVKSLLG
ncbi:MAG: hypothetical protein CVV13_13525 [Gammaproteobacteria bacterium HGW-Gammaproteobacteria-3]|nr:MAG: hypothetical protein CVV13_13525 [Gammaproteobacteria bacterium HGW-Gammaproteobacteria-3]